jgi:hypothetical protein
VPASLWPLLLLLDHMLSAGCRCERVRHASTLYVTGPTRISL